MRIYCEDEMLYKYLKYKGIIDQIKENVKNNNIDKEYKSYE